MQLQYHQATYDLLTQKPINPQTAIDHFDQYSLNKYEPIETEEKRLEIAKNRERSLAWTRLGLYQRPVQFSEANIQKLDALEQQYNVKLPEALREWYSLDIVPEIMSVDGWGFMEIENMKPIKDLGFRWLKHVEDDLWYFLDTEYIGQGGEYLVCRLGAGENPPVFAEHDRELIQLAPTFSEFIYMHIWRWHSRYGLDYGFSTFYHAELPVLGTSPTYYRPLKHLRQHYTELRGNLSLYFYDEHCRIEARTLADDPEMMAGGEFFADSLETLQKLMTTIWGDDPPLFKMMAWEAEAIDLLKRLQRERMLKQLNQYKDWVNEVELAQSLGASRPNLSTDMAEALQWLIANDKAEVHPDFRKTPKSEHRFRVKR